MNTGNDDIRFLNHFTSRLRSDPLFMAHILTNYQVKNGLNDDELLHELGIPSEMIIRLALCKVPDAASSDFTHEIRQLSDFTLIDESLLEQVIRRSTIPAYTTPLKKHKLSVWSWKSRQIWRDWTAIRRWVIVTASMIFLISSISLYFWKKSANALEGNREQTILIKPLTPDIPIISSVKPEARESPRKQRIVDTDQRKALRIDLEEYAVFRGDIQPDSLEEKVIRFPAARNRVLFKLPKDSSNGTYIVNVVDPFGSAVTTTKTISAGGKRLTVKLDMREMIGKRYRLCVTRNGEAPDCYPIIIKRS